MENQLQTEMKEAVPGVGNVEYVSLTWDNFLQVHLTAINSGTALISSPLVSALVKYSREWALFIIWIRSTLTRKLKAKYDEVPGTPAAMKATWYRFPG